jgi:restriction endonuclease
MAGGLRSMMKENEFDLGDAFDRVVKGLQNEMNAVISKIEQSRDTSPEGLKSMIKTGLESVVLAVEKVVDGISDGMAEARKIKEREEMRTKGDENWKREQDMKKRVRDIKKMEERLEKMEDRMRNERKKRKRRIKSYWRKYAC